MARKAVTTMANEPKLMPWIFADIDEIIDETYQEATDGTAK